MGHAKALLAIKNPARLVGAAETVVLKALSVRETEALAKKLNRLDSEIEAIQDEDEAPLVDYTAELARKMTSRLGRRVVIRGKGNLRRLEISVANDEDLDEIVTKLCGNNIFDE